MTAVREVGQSGSLDGAELAQLDAGMDSEIESMMEAILPSNPASAQAPSAPESSPRAALAPEPARDEALPLPDAAHPWPGHSPSRAHEVGDAAGHWQHVGHLVQTVHGISQLAHEHVKVVHHAGTNTMRKQYMPSQARWSQLSHYTETMGLVHSTKSSMLIAKFRGLDRVGHGFAGWQAPLIIFGRLFSAVCTLFALIDVFGNGQLACNEMVDEGPFHVCTRTKMVELLALNQTSVYPDTALDVWRPDPVPCAAQRGVAGAESDCTHPDSIWRKLVVALVIGMVALALMLDGIFRRPQLQVGGLKANRAAILEMFAVLVATLINQQVLKSIRKDAPKAYGRLQSLAAEGVDAADFDPMSAAVYARAGTLVESVTMFLVASAWFAQLNSWFALNPRKITSNPLRVLDPKAASGGSKPVAPRTIARRQWQASVFVGVMVYLFLGALFYRFNDEDKYPTVVQAFYFAVVTCTTVGYGEVTPDGVASRVLTIFFSFFGIVGMGIFMLEMGDILITASEVPMSFVLRRVVLHFCPGAFPGISSKAWKAAGLVVTPTDRMQESMRQRSRTRSATMAARGNGSDLEGGYRKRVGGSGNALSSVAGEQDVLKSIKRRTAWIGNIPYHATEASIASQSCMGQFGTIEKVILQRRGASPSEGQRYDLRESWALVTYMLDSEHYTEDRDDALGMFCHAVAMAQSTAVHHNRREHSPADRSDTVRLVVLPASRRIIGARALEAAQAQANLRMALAMCTWVVVLCGVGPWYVGTWHPDWSYMDAVWFSYTTMTGIGYGDLHPNSHRSGFQDLLRSASDSQAASDDELADLSNHHAVYIW